jgi:hypothetical protein
MAFITNANYDDLEQLDRERLVYTHKVAELFGYTHTASVGQAVKKGVFPKPIASDFSKGNAWTVEQLLIEFYRRRGLLSKYEALLKERAFYLNR